MSHFGRQATVLRSCPPCTTGESGVARSLRSGRAAHASQQAGQELAACQAPRQKGGPQGLPNHAKRRSKGCSCRFAHLSDPWALLAASVHAPAAPTNLNVVGARAVHRAGFPAISMAAAVVRRVEHGATSGAFPSASGVHTSARVCAPPARRPLPMVEDRTSTCRFAHRLLFHSIRTTTRAMAVAEAEAAGAITAGDHGDGTRPDNGMRYTVQYEHDLQLGCSSTGTGTSAVCFTSTHSQLSSVRAPIRGGRHAPRAWLAGCHSGGHES